MGDKSKNKYIKSKVLVSMDGGSNSIMPLTLYDFYFIPPGIKKIMKKDSMYIFSILDNQVANN